LSSNSGTTTKKTKTKNKKPQSKNKTFYKLGIEDYFLKLIENIYRKPTTDICEGFPLKSGVWQGFLLLPLLFNIELKFIVREIRHEKNMNSSKLERQK
jgi:hypothetical protein